MKILYFDCFSGISGDMAVASLLDLGISTRHLESELRKLGLSKEYRLHFSRGKQQQMAGVKFDVHISGDKHEHHHHNDHGRQTHSHGRTFADIRRLIKHSKLSPFVRQKSVSLFHCLAVAEGKIHGIPVDKVHFHEVGAIDSIVDIVGICILMEALNPQQILASAPCEGHGFVECAHGRFPVPTPATLELLKGIPLRQINIAGELITPTGAAILAEFVEKFGPMPSMVIKKIGYGLGSRSYPDHPNVLRAVWGEVDIVKSASSGTAVDVLETNVDDVSPEILAAAMEKLLAEGARDVFLTPIQMKKGRSATLITVLAEPGDADHLARMLLRETGSFGLRIRRSERICLIRETRKIKTRLGPVEIKIGSQDGAVITAKPEFESCRKLAQKLKKPVRIVWLAAMAECFKILDRISE